MLQDKRGDLDGERQKRVLLRLVETLSQSHGDLYYHPTSTIAMLLRKHIDEGTGLNADERDLLRPLGQRDIEILLSLH